LESEAEPGQIVVSQAVADQLDGVELEDLGERSLKNVPEPVRCWAVS
jgi:class 3 adenylate cyclase